MQYTIHEAQLAYETYGTLCHCDADERLCTVYDDDEDERIKWYIVSFAY